MLKFFLIFLTIWKFFTVIFSPSVLLLPVHQTNSKKNFSSLNYFVKRCWQFIIGHEEKGDPEKKFQMTISQILAPSTEKKSLMKYESEKVWKLNVNEFPICGNILCIEQIIFYKSQFLSKLDPCVMMKPRKFSIKRKFLNF